VPDLHTILPLLNSAGTLGVLVLIVYGGSRGWWVYGRTYEEMKSQRDDYKLLATQGIASIQKVVDLIESLLARRDR